MKLDTVARLLIFASIVVFAIHNTEEALGIQDWMAARFSPEIARYYRTDQFSTAAFLLWLSYAAVAGAAIFSNRLLVRRLFAMGFAAIVANGLVHVIAMPVLGETSPGFWSAILLVLPLGGLFARDAIAKKSLTPANAAILLIGGAIVQIPLAAIALITANSLPMPEMR